LSSPALFPIAAIYQYATGSRAATMGLLIIIFLPSFWSIIGAYETAGRTLWTLGRDNAAPFSGFVGRLSPKHHNPWNATLVVAVLNTLLGLTYLGSTTAFNAFATSVVCLIIISYIAAIGPYLFSGRATVERGHFWMSGIWGRVVHSITCAYIATFLVIFCFPYAMPVHAETMNYSSAIVGGIGLGITGWWFWKNKHGYIGFGKGLEVVFAHGSDDNLDYARHSNVGKQDPECQRY